MWWRLLGGLVGLLCWGTLHAQISDSDCLECHSDPDLTNATGRAMVVHPTEIAQSIHNGLACVDCHTSIVEIPHAEGGLPNVPCQVCHEESQTVFATSAHGLALTGGDTDAPVCADCHGSHGILSSKDLSSSTHRANLAVTCARCHANPKVVQRHPFSVNAPVDAYYKSVHFKALIENGVAQAPSCNDCHNSHGLKRASDPESSIYWRNVPQMCGKCHVEILKTYEASVHGQAAARGDRQSPVCTDCHGEHEIRGPQDPKSSVYPAHVSKATCVWCHESVRVVQKYGLPQSRLNTYLDSYHGLADKAGSVVVANCASCHGVHDIFPSSDPRSTIYAANLPHTCGKCHPGAGENFAIGVIHVDPDDENGSSWAIHFVQRFYLWLIVGTIGFMLLHNGLDFARNFRVRKRLPDGNDFLRFTVGERIQHMTMALSFLVLAYSGFALKFPAAWWAAPFTWMSDPEIGRRMVHRIAAVAMVGVCAFHLGYLLLNTRGRKQLVAMMPRLKDVRDFRQMVQLYLGKGHNHPKFARFSYIEKLEYWALVWGSVVMTVTGFALWFANVSLRFVPKWILDVATVIHYYEAWLAALAIIVWHFYWVIFNPRLYPMSLVWLTGRMSKEAMEEEHPLELKSEQ